MASPASPPDRPDSDSIAERLKQQFGDRIDPTPSLDPEPAADKDAPSSLFEKLRVAETRGARYRLLGEVARGGMGVILKIWDDELRRTLAMKVVLGHGDVSTGDTPIVDPKTLGRFLEEAQVTGQLDHPGIVPVHELGLGADGRVYFTMRLVKGEDLRRIFEKVRGGEDGWNQVRALGVLLKVCEAMSYAHSKKVVHRDLKPANIMVGRFGEVYVMDWGLARVLGREDKHDPRIQPQAASQSVVKTERRERREDTPDSPLVTMDGDVVGTPSFMPPEQAKGQLDMLGPHSDVYALGAMLYQLLTGQMPYVPGGTLISQRTILAAVIAGPPESIGELAPKTSPELVSICEKAMARDILARYSDTTALASDLRAYFEQRVVKAHATGAAAELKKWAARNKTVVATIAASVLVIAIGTGIAFEALKRKQRETITALRHSEVLRLCAASTIQLTRSPALALCLAVEAGEREKGVETFSAMSDAVGSSHERRTLIGHTSWVGSAIFSPDGSKVLTASHDNTARVWDVESGKSTVVLRDHKDGIARASFSPDGSKIITLSEMTFENSGHRIHGAPDGKIARVWGAVSGDLLFVLRGHEDHVNTASFSPDGSRIVTASEDGTARVWDAASGDQLVLLKGGESRQVHGASFSPDGSRVLTLGTLMASIWNLASGVEAVTLHGHDGLVSSAEFSPDGSRVVTASWDQTARVWEAATGKELVVLRGHEDILRIASFSPDGSRVVTCSEDKTARVWNAVNGQQVALFGDDVHEVWTATFSPDGSRALSITDDNAACLWNAATGKECAILRGHEAGLQGAIFSPDGTRVVTASEDGSARVWDVTGVKGFAVVRGSDQFPSQTWTVSLNGDCSRIVTSMWDPVAHVWNVASGMEIASLKTGEYAVCNARFSADGSRIVTVSMDGTARVWTSESGQELTVLKGEGMWSATFSFDGSRVVTSEDKISHVWDATSGKELVVLSGHELSVESAAFSPDGSKVVTASDDQTARVWDAVNGKELVVLKGHTQAVASAAFSPDGSKVVTASDDKTARVWDAQSGNETALLQGHDLAVVTAAFSPDSQKVLTTSSDKTARVWDATSGECVAIIGGHARDVRTAGFSADGSKVVTVSTGWVLHTWPLDLLPLAKSLAPRELLPEERRTYGLDADSR